MAIFWRTGVRCRVNATQRCPVLVGHHPDAVAIGRDPSFRPGWSNGKTGGDSVRVDIHTSKQRFLPQIGTHTLPNPNARPEQASPGILTFATIRFVAGSIRWTEYGFEPDTHTESSATKSQSAVAPILNVAERFNESNGT
jgi:hypothetical protein